ncbi:DUF6232 family protein [Mucilaginibacter flavidus]|uniref:DUF6232 family protein n=1 Tax=Mucilaginibacter flavidus TaxID=2949309 RepID=UPI0020938830|nr:DUF6232 family protein [Mucilaginibacter flavidus]MCO5949232.1 DUF6232 family protein [Mucilaginibacter flavidus]
MDEKQFYENGEVIVTQSRFIVGSKTYAMRNISSVQIGVIEPNRTLGYILLIIGIVVALAAENKVFGIIVAVIAGVFLFTQKTKYSVRIATNSGAMDGLISESKEYIRQIVAALNEAIVHMG